MNAYWVVFDSGIAGESHVFLGLFMHRPHGYAVATMLSQQYDGRLRRFFIYNIKSVRSPNGSIEERSNIAADIAREYGIPVFDYMPTLEEIADFALRSENILGKQIS